MFGKVCVGWGSLGQERKCKAGGGGVIVGCVSLCQVREYKAGGTKWSSTQYMKSTASEGVCHKVKKAGEGGEVWNRQKSGPGAEI